MKEFQIDQEYKLVFNDSTKHWDYFQNGKLLPKETDELFKFYSLNFNNIDALYNQYFFLSNPKDFNDPFDCNINLIEDIEPETLKPLKTVRRNSIGNIGISSFSETIDNHLMWAHYTDNYYGFALKFNGKELDAFTNHAKLKKWTLTRVIYFEKLKRIKSEFKFALHYVLTSKLKHWKYEKEWRIIAELGDLKKRILYYDKKSIKALYVGHRLVDENPSAYRIIMNIHNDKFPDIPLYVVYPHKTELKLHFEKIKYK